MSSRIDKAPTDNLQTVSASYLALNPNPIMEANFDGTILYTNGYENGVS
jgi:hypothetical protein